MTPRTALSGTVNTILQRVDYGGRRLANCDPHKRLRRQRPLTMESLERRELLAGDVSVSVSLPPASLVGSPVAGAVQNVLATKIVAFDVTTIGKLSFNLSTGGYSANVELPAGVKLDTSALKTLMAGQLAVPKIQPIQAVTSLAGLKTNVTSNYEQVQSTLIKQYGGGNVYVSTPRFGFPAGGRSRSARQSSSGQSHPGCCVDTLTPHGLSSDTVCCPTTWRQGT